MNRNRRWLLLAMIASTGAVASFAACGDDTGTGSNADAGADAGTDATTKTDSAAGQDATNEKGGGDAATEGAACTGYDAANLDPTAVEGGFYAVWQVYKCQGCHQKSSQKVDDAGNGIVLSGNNDGIGDSGMTFPPNLTSDPMTGLGCWTDDQITNAILHGTDSDGGKLCPAMPKFGNALTLADGAARPGTPMDAGTASQIVDFLRSLSVANNAVTDTMCPMMGDAGMASEGGDAEATDAGAEAASQDAADGATE